MDQMLLYKIFMIILYEYLFTKYIKPDNLI